MLIPMTTVFKQLALTMTSLHYDTVACTVPFCPVSFLIIMLIVRRYINSRAKPISKAFPSRLVDEQGAPNDLIPRSVNW